MSNEWQSIKIKNCSAKAQYTTNIEIWKNGRAAVEMVAHAGDITDRISLLLPHFVNC